MYCSGLFLQIKRLPALQLIRWPLIISYRICLSKVHKLHIILVEFPGRRNSMVGAIISLREPSCSCTSCGNPEIESQTNRRIKLEENRGQSRHTLCCVPYRSKEPVKLLSFKDRPVYKALFRMTDYPFPVFDGSYSSLIFRRGVGKPFSWCG